MRPLGARMLTRAFAYFPSSEALERKEKAAGKRPSANSGGKCCRHHYAAFSRKILPAPSTFASARPRSRPGATSKKAYVVIVVRAIAKAIVAPAAGWS